MHSNFDKIWLSKLNFDKLYCRSYNFGKDNRRSYNFDNVVCRSCNFGKNFVEVITSANSVTSARHIYYIYSGLQKDLEQYQSRYIRCFLDFLESLFWDFGRFILSR